MSWDCTLEHQTGDTAVLPDGMRAPNGGTYVAGGTSEAWLNITYNYTVHFHRVLDTEKGLAWLNGRKANDTIARLETAVSSLTGERDRDYWAGTEGNAKVALQGLLDMAKALPDCKWKVT